jgi:hypothetical protein
MSIYAQMYEEAAQRLAVAEEDAEAWMEDLREYHEVSKLWAVYPDETFWIGSAEQANRLIELTAKFYGHRLPQLTAEFHGEQS